MDSELEVEVYVRFIKWGLIIVIIAAIAGAAKMFYGLLDASKESITESAKSDCVKEYILGHRPEYGAINKSTLWGYQRDCELKKEYLEQTELIGKN